MRSHYQFLVLEYETLEFCLENLPLCQWFQDSHFLLHKIQFVWFYVEVLDPLGLDLCARWQIWVYFHFSPVSVLDQHHLLKMLSCFLLFIFGFFVKYQMYISMWFYFWGLNSISLFNVSVSVSVPCSFLSLMLWSKAWGQGWWFPPVIMFLLRFVFPILCFLPFQMNLRIAFSMSLKNCPGILIGIW